eukprot:5944786-Amphidinium_carterae.2
MNYPPGSASATEILGVNELARRLDESLTETKTGHTPSALGRVPRPAAISESIWQELVRTPDGRLDVLAMLMAWPRCAPKS